MDSGRKSIPIGGLDIVTDTASKRDAQRHGHRAGNIRFLKPGQKTVLRACDGVVIATGHRRMLVTDAQGVDTINEIVRTFKMHGIPAGEIGMCFQFPTPGTEGMLVDRARGLGIQSVWVMHAVAEPAGDRKQKHIMLKRNI